MRVLELGAGMSGLAGLGVAACSDAAEVVITDGNPDALRNLEECVELNAKEGVFGDTRVAARRLVWDSLDRNGDRAALLSRSSSEVGGSGRFDLIIASDCLFFKDFHDDLISTIGGLLRPGGRAVRERWRRQAAAAAGPEAGAVGHATGSGAGVGVGEDGHAAVEGAQQKQQQQQQQLWVAVAGAPGSGKTTLATEVCRRVQSEEISAICLPMDGYHLYRRELDLLPDPREAHRRRGAHWTFDGRRFLSELGYARRSGRGSFPGFDHARGDPVENQWDVQPSHSVVIVEGNYLLLEGVDPWDQVGGLFDVTWAIRCPPEVCGERLRRRHMSTGLGEEEARARVEGNDLPNARLVSEKCPWSEVDVVIDSL
ncbi:unnamed protein product [Ectocarpus sp. 12 AP-2014]